MRRWVLFGTAMLVATAGAGGNAWAASAPAAPQALRPHKVTERLVAGHKVFTPGIKQVVRLDPKTAQPQSKALALPNSIQNLATLPVTAKINVTYVGFSAPARQAFQAAVNIWQTQIHSTVPIDVVADFSNLTQQYNDPSILGAAGPTDFVENFTHAPLQNVAYPIALANAISGADQLPANVCDSDPSAPNPSGAEISASFNSDQSAWYFGTDGHPGGSQVDFESVVLHELGHGLGFVGSYDVPDANGTGVGDYGLTADGQNPTIFDTFTADGSGQPLGATYGNDTQALGNALRGIDGGVEWTGTAGDTAAGGHPELFAPSPFEEGSSFSHLDEDLYPPSSGNALMTPGLEFGESEHAPGPIMLGMFKDMGWPQTGSPAAIGDYHVAAPKRLVSQVRVNSSTPLSVPIEGVDGLPQSGVKSVVVNVAVQAPTKPGYWSSLPGCSGTGLPDTQNFLAGQTRSALAVLPVGDSGQISISLTASPAAAMSGVVSVDLVGWYGTGGVSYHQLASEKQALSKLVGTTAVDVPILGVAGIPTSGVTAVVMSAGVGFESKAGALVVGAGGGTSIIPTVAYDAGELTSNMAIVPVNAGKIRVRVTAGAAAVSLYAIGWYGPSATGAQAFHSAGPMHVPVSGKGQDVTFSGFPGSTPVMLDVHLGNPSVRGSLSVAPGGSSLLALVQEFKAHQPTSGTLITMTNAAGQVRLRLSAGSAAIYVDFQGWFSA